MLKLELDVYNASVLRHIGNALVSIAKDRESERGKAVTDCTAGRAEVYGLQPAIDDTPIVGQLAAAAFQAPPPPAVEEPLPQGTALPPIEQRDALGYPSGPVEDDGFPDPPKGTVPAPPAADTTPPPPPAATELDSAGIPWDARIHAATKTKCKDGSWKNKPGVDPALLAAVTAELKSVQAIPTPPAQVTGTVIPPAPTGPTTFAELVAAVGPLVAPGGKLTPDQVNAVCQAQGLPNLGALGARQDLIPTVWSQICLIAG